MVDPLNALSLIPSKVLYRIVRDHLRPWAQSQHFRALKTGMLAWTRPFGAGQTTLWFQVRQRGWDPYAGSAFTMEFQFGHDERPGAVRAFRLRFGRVLTDEDRKSLWELENAIIRSLPNP